MSKIIEDESASRPTWPTLERCGRAQVQARLQRVLEEDVEELLGRPPVRRVEARVVSRILPLFQRATGLLSGFSARLSESE